jgi:F-type H+-transporting ATPase subunit a
MSDTASEKAAPQATAHPAGHQANPFDASHLFGHVQDSTYFEMPKGPWNKSGKIPIPQPFPDSPSFRLHTGIKQIDDLVEPMNFKLTKFMVLEVVVALMIAVLFIGLANRMAGGKRIKGRFWNLLETMVVFIRDQVARSAIGRHDADRFVPLLWTIFFFVLGCNLLGMFPWAGTPTASLATTGAMALITFGTVIGCGMYKFGVLGFWKVQVPHMDLPGSLKYFLVPMIFAIEVIGLFIRHFVLSVRLLANMLAGHLVLAVLLAFITAIALSAQTYFSVTLWGVWAASVLGAVALSLLELFVAFLQAYIFVFLSALFIGAAVHPH